MSPEFQPVFLKCAGAFCCLTQAAARRVSADVVKMMSNVGDMLSDTLEVGDPPATVRLGKMTLHVSKQKASILAKEVIRSHIGSIAIEGRYDVSDDSCVVSKVYATAQEFFNRSRRVVACHIVTFRTVSTVYIGSLREC